MHKFLDQHVCNKAASRVGAAVAVLAFSATASAVEATEFDIPASIKSREQVRQELVLAQQENRHLSRGQGSEYHSFDAVSQNGRQAVKAQAQRGVAGAQQRELFAGG